MMISKIQMQTIVEEIEKIIHRHINIMDKTGIIIASTDPQRIGTVHEAARILIQKNLPELEISDLPHYEGSRHGINLPIVIQEEVVGVVGITGRLEEVRDLGAVIQKMTEILIMEASQKEQTQLYKRACQTFICRWLFEDSEDDQLELNGKILGIDTELSRIAAVIKPCPIKEDGQDALLAQKLQSSLSDIAASIIQSTPQRNTISVTIGTQLLLLCHTNQYSVAAAMCEQISRRFRELHSALLAVGIGTVGTNRKEIARSCHEAERACYLSANTHGNMIRHYAESELSLLLTSLSPEYKTDFINKIFCGIKGDELRQWMLLLRVFFDSNGSIQMSADQLYIHKNTLQYRLNKLKQKTGYDPRIYSDAFTLNGALILYEALNQVH